MQFHYIVHFHTLFTLVWQVTRMSLVPKICWHVVNILQDARKILTQVRIYEGNWNLAESPVMSLNVQYRHQHQCCQSTQNPGPPITASYTTTSIILIHSMVQEIPWKVYCLLGLHKNSQLSLWNPRFISVFPKACHWTLSWAGCIQFMYHPTKFNFLLWILAWIKIFMATCKTRLMCPHVILEIGLFQSNIGVQCWSLSVLFTICQYISGVNGKNVWALRTV